jgi:predicted metal-dependent peptidase
MTVLTTVQKILTHAKIRARGWMPYLSHVFGTMRGHVTDKVPTMAVDEGARLYVNEEYLDTLSPNNVAYVLLHETLHVALSHGKRFRLMMPGATERERLAWNIATDLVIEQMLRRHLRLHAPPNIVTIDGCIPAVPGNIRFRDVDGMREGLCSEQYLSLILPLLPESCMQRQDGEEPSLLDPRDAGSNSDGMARDYEKPSSVIERAMLDNALEQAAEQLERLESSDPGSVPGDLGRTIAMRFRQQPDPCRELAHVVSKSVASPIGEEYLTYSRLSRRQQPDLYRKRGVLRYSPECSIIVDVSGSMSGLEDKALTAVAQGLKRVQQPRVMLFDCAVQDERRMARVEQFCWKGYGGTDMTSAVERADTKHRPDAIVVITDGETRWPVKQTRARLIIALVKQSRYPTPQWARIVECYKEVPTYGY